MGQFQKVWQSAPVEGFAVNPTNEVEFIDLFQWIFQDLSWISLGFFSKSWLEMVEFEIPTRWRASERFSKDSAVLFWIIYADVAWLLDILPVRIVWDSLGILDTVSVRIIGPVAQESHVVNSIAAVSVQRSKSLTLVTLHYANNFLFPKHVLHSLLNQFTRSR